MPAHEAHPVAPEESLAFPEALDKRTPLSRALYAHLQWWLKEDNVLKGQPLHPLQHALQLFTDASNEGWGAHLGDYTAKCI